MSPTFRALQLFAGTYEQLVQAFPSPNAGVPNRYRVFTSDLGWCAWGTTFQSWYPLSGATLDPRFFNGSNAWLGFRTSSGGGTW